MSSPARVGLDLLPGEWSIVVCVRTSGTAPLAETPDLVGAFPRLSDLQVRALAAHGERRRTEPGDVLYRQGEECRELLVIVAGKVAVVEEYGRQERVIAVHGPGRFLGEVNLFIGRVAFLTAVVREAGEVLAVPVRACPTPFPGTPPSVT
jgi:thioredoxin reductase (NADPH)